MTSIPNNCLKVIKCSKLNNLWEKLEPFVTLVSQRPLVPHPKSLNSRRRISLLGNRLIL